MIGFKLLCQLTSIDGTTTYTPVVEAVVFAMIFHFSSETIQLTGCKLLSCCSFHRQSENDLFDLDSMIAEAVISGMENFPRRVKIQEHAVKALEKMSSRQTFLVALQSHSSRVINAIHYAISFSDSMQTFERGSDVMSKM